MTKDLEALEALRDKAVVNLARKEALLADYTAGLRCFLPHAKDAATTFLVLLLKGQIEVRPLLINGVERVVVTTVGGVAVGKGVFPGLELVGVNGTALGADRFRNKVQAFKELTKSEGSMHCEFQKNSAAAHALLKDNNDRRNDRKDRMRAEAVLFASMQRSAVVVQKWARAVEKASAFRKQEAVVHLQAWLRTVPQACKFKAMRTVVIRVQAAARGKAAVRRLRRAVKAGTKLQALARGAAAAHAFQASLAACIMLQAAFRCRRAAKAFAAAIVQVQSLLRSRVATRSLAAAQNAATVVSAAWKRHAASTSFASMQRSALVVQAWARAVAKTRAFKAMRVQAAARRAAALWQLRITFHAEDPHVNGSLGTSGDDDSSSVGGSAGDIGGELGRAASEQRSQEAKGERRLELWLKGMVERRVLDYVILPAFHAKTKAGLLGAPYEEAGELHVLQVFFELVVVLDAAKQHELLPGRPCLLKPTSHGGEFGGPGCAVAGLDRVSSSMNMLCLLSREFMGGDGNVVTHLGLLGVAVSHAQTPLDEFDFATISLAVDLRDGVRLTRLVETLAPTAAAQAAATAALPLAIAPGAADAVAEEPLSRLLRLPAVSRLQKVHNVELALKALLRDAPHHDHGPHLAEALAIAANYELSARMPLRTPKAGGPMAVAAWSVCHASSLASQAALEEVSFGGVRAREVGDGFRSQTLSLLRRPMAQYDLATLLDVPALEAEVVAVRLSWRAGRLRALHAQCSSSRTVSFAPPADAAALLVIEQTAAAAAHTRLAGSERDWHAGSVNAPFGGLVCGGYGVAWAAGNVGGSLADGRALCTLLHYYPPRVMPLAHVQPTTALLPRPYALHSGMPSSTPCQSKETEARAAVAWAAELANGALANARLLELGGGPLVACGASTCVEQPPEPRLALCFLAHVCQRLLESSAMVRAAVAPQAMRQRQYRRTLRKLKAIRAAEIRVQKAARGKAALLRLRRAVAAETKLQALIRSAFAAHAFQASVAACVVLQGAFRCCRGAKAFAAGVAAIVQVQILVRARMAVRPLAAVAAWRRHAASTSFASMQRSALVVQACARAVPKTCAFKAMRAAAIQVQKAARRAAARLRQLCIAFHAAVPHVNDNQLERIAPGGRARLLLLFCVTLIGAAACTVAAEWKCQLAPVLAAAETKAGTAAKPARPNGAPASESSNVSEELVALYWRWIEPLAPLPLRPVTLLALPAPPADPEAASLQEDPTIGEWMVEEEPSDFLLKARPEARPEAWPEALIALSTDAQPLPLAGPSSAALCGQHLAPHAPTSGLMPPALFWSPKSRRDRSAWTRRTARALLDSSVGRNAPGLAAIVYGSTADAFASSAGGGNLDEKNSLGSSSNSRHPSSSNSSNLEKSSFDISSCSRFALVIPTLFTSLSQVCCSTLQTRAAARSHHSE